MTVWQKKGCRTCGSTTLIEYQRVMKCVHGNVHDFGI